eukprot:365363-Chlamydomonas_euryale.AAC.3
MATAVARDCRLVGSAAQHATGVLCRAVHRCSVARRYADGRDDERARCGPLRVPMSRGCAGR